MLSFREMTVNIGSVQHKVFLQDGFYNKSVISDILHHHRYTEVHLIIDGSVGYTMGDRSIAASDGTMLVIPPGVMHSGKRLDEGTLCAAFQIDADVNDTISFKIDKELIRSMFDEIDEAAKTDDYSGIAAYVTILCRRFIESDGVRAERITDCGFLIHEFFSHRYAEDVTLSDLAKTLHLSDRQTERLVHKCTGRSFRDELSRSRVLVASRLLAEGSMSLGEIAAYVGYRSYAGFWKTMKKYGLI